MNPFSLFNFGKSAFDAIGGLFSPQPAQVASLPMSSYTNPQAQNYRPAISSSTVPTAQNYKIPASSATNPNAANYQPSGQVLGASTGGGNAPQQQQQPAQPSAEEIARRQYEDQLNSANRQFDERASYLNNQLGDVGQEKDSLLDRIGSTYTNVRQQAQDTLTKNLGSLETGKGEVKQGYGDLRTEQSRLLGDTQLRNRNLARSLGSLNSSFYENLQNKANATTQANVSRIGQQEQSQLDKIGQEIVSQNTDANTKLQSLNETEAAAKTDILNKYQSIYNTIQTQLGFNDRGKLEAVQSMSNQLQNTLDNITLTMQAYKQQASSLAGVQNPVKSALDQVNLLSTINKSGLLQPIQQNNVLAEAMAGYNANPTEANYENIVGYLGKADPRALLQFQQSIPQPTGGIFGFGQTRPQIPNPLQYQNPQSFLDQLLPR